MTGRAATRAEAVAQWVENGCGDEDCDYEEAEVVSLERVTDRLWKARMRFSPPTRFRCVAIDLDHFRMSSNGATFHGASRVPCSGGD